MRHLYLHIGFHKTGSTSLQNALWQRRKALLCQGFEVLSLTRKGDSSCAVTVQRRDGRLECRTNSRFERLLKSGQGERVIVSAEHLCFLYDPAEIAAARAVCERYFDRVTVVAYLRRQDQQAVSFKQQGAKAFEPARRASHFLLGHDDGALPVITEAVEHYYDYHQKLLHWAESFGEENLVVRPFDRHQLVGGDVVSDFAALLGEGVSLPAVRVNEAGGRKEFLLTHRLFRLGLASGELRKLKRAMRAEGDKVLPGRSEAQAFFAHFEKSNRLLNDRFLPHESGLAFDESFDRYPLVGNDSITGRDIERWTPDLFAAGLRDPRGVRDALVAQRLRELAVGEMAGPELKEELNALSGGLAKNASVTPESNSPVRRLRLLLRRRRQFRD